MPISFYYYHITICHDTNSKTIAITLITHIRDLCLCYLVLLPRSPGQHFALPYFVLIGRPKRFILRRRVVRSCVFFFPPVFFFRSFFLLCLPLLSFWSSLGYFCRKFRCDAEFKVADVVWTWVNKKIVNFNQFICWFLTRILLNKCNFVARACNSEWNLVPRREENRCVFLTSSPTLKKKAAAAKMKLLTYQDTRQRFFNPFHTTTSALDDVWVDDSGFSVCWLIRFGWAPFCTKCVLNQAMRQILQNLKKFCLNFEDFNQSWSIMQKNSAISIQIHRLLQA